MPLARTTRYRPGAFIIALYGALVLLFGSFAGRAYAAPVPNLYSARVATEGSSSGPALEAAFARALGEVLVKITGRRAVAAEPAARSLIAGAGSLVRQYQPLPGGMLRVEFDPGSVRSRLDAANLPVWGDDRPVILLWVSVPGEQGPVLVTDAYAGGPPADARTDAVGAARQALLTAAGLRGLAVVLPAAGVTLPGDPDGTAAARARAEQIGADGVLVGQAAPESGQAALRWTLVLADDRQEWQGDLAEGMHALADRLAARYATTASSRRALHLAVYGIGTFGQYGQAQGYLRALDLVERVAVDRVVGEVLLFSLTVRGDPRQLQDVLSLRGLLVPVTGTEGTIPADPAVAGADLSYRFVGSR